MLLRDRRFATRVDTLLKVEFSPKGQKVDEEKEEEKGGEEED